MQRTGKGCFKEREQHVQSPRGGQEPREPRPAIEWSRAGRWEVIAMQGTQGGGVAGAVGGARGDRDTRVSKGSPFLPGEMEFNVRLASLTL